MHIFDSPCILWKPPLQKPTLQTDCVHVWCASLQRSASEIEALIAILSVEERERASKFHFLQHQRRFVVARGILRSLLANYLAVNPQDLEFSYRERGKPELANYQDLQFNLSHSEELAVYAFALKHEVGIDLEYLRDAPDIEQIATRFFTKWESEALRSLPQPEQKSAFFRCWTRKEAYLKACGDGLGGGLDQIEVSLTPEAEIRQINHPQGAHPWKLYNLLPATNYVGAIASPLPQIEIIGSC